MFFIKSKGKYYQFSDDSKILAKSNLDQKFSEDQLALNKLQNFASPKTLKSIANLTQKFKSGFKSDKVLLMKKSDYIKDPNKIQAIVYNTGERAQNIANKLSKKADLAFAKGNTKVFNKNINRLESLYTKKMDNVVKNLTKN